MVGVDGQTDNSAGLWMLYWKCFDWYEELQIVGLRVKEAEQRD